MGRWLIGGLIVLFVVAVAWENSRPAGVIMMIVVLGALIMHVSNKWSSISSRGKAPCDHKKGERS